jgi:PAT family beta-lactamase induction signal transducer AmpG
MQGIPAGFALTAISNYLLGHNIASYRVGTFMAIVGLPWTIQFIWGPLIDRFQYSFLGHRKHWVVISQWLAILASLGLLIVTDPTTQLTLLGAMFFIHSVFASIQDASVDAMAISIATVNERGKLNAFMRGGFLMGISLGAAGLSLMIHHYGFREAVLAQTATLIAFSLIFFFTKLDRDDSLLPGSSSNSSDRHVEKDNPSLGFLFRSILKGITNPKSLQYFAIITSVYLCGSIFIRSYTYHLINVLRWPDQSVSVLQGGWGSIITFVAIVIAGYVSDKVGAKKMQVAVMWTLCIYLIILSSTFSLWRYDLYSGAALVFWNLADPLLSVAVFPILMGLCLKKVEGSQFTAYMALINLCDVLGSYITGWTLTIASAPVIIICCGLFLLSLLILMKRNNNYQVIPG